MERVTPATALSRQDRSQYEPHMKRIRSNILAVLLLVIWLSGCSSGVPTGESGHPAAPPAPPSELPMLRFPAQIAGEFDVSTVGKAGTGAALAALVVEGDNIASEISDSAQNTIVFSSLVDEILRPLHDLKIPISTRVTNFQDVIVIGDQLTNVKIDFSAYENKEGVTCSGSTAAPPICYRIWFNQKRALSGVFLNSIPTEGDPGDGRIQGLSPVKILGVIPFAMSVTYDLRDASARSAEFYIGAMIEGHPLDDIPADESGFDVTVHASLSQEGPAESALKTANTSIKSSDGSATERHIGRWKEGDDYWSGTKDTNTINDLSEFGDFFDACAQISSGLVVNSSFCTDPDRDIDAGGIDFLEFLKIEDVAFPSDFPESPTFL